MTEQEPYGLILSFKVGNSIFDMLSIRRLTTALKFSTKISKQ